MLVGLGAGKVEITAMILTSPGHRLVTDLFEGSDSGFIRPQPRLLSATRLSRRSRLSTTVAAERAPRR